MRNQISYILTGALLCLSILHTSNAFANDGIAMSNQQATISVNAKEYAGLLDLAYRIQSHKILYKFLNETFADFLKIDPDKQSAMGWPASSKGLSESQVVYLLSINKEFQALAADYLAKVNVNNINDTDVVQARNQFKDSFNKVLSAIPDWQDKLKAHVDPTIPLNVGLPQNQPGYSDINMYVNHPRLTQEQKTIPADNLKQVVIDFVGQAKGEIWYNVFDFDLKEVAQAFVNANKKGVHITGGIDKGTVDARPEVKQILDFLNSQAKSDLTTRPVDSVGLNHMKVIVRDPEGPNAAVLFLSGNFTQSCIGPEGDLAQIPANQRPANSVPNANHAILIKGQLPAIIARHHLKKVLIDGLHGQSDYPISGAYRVIGPVSAQDHVPDWVTISFSPNGGMGDINSDVLKQFILNTEGPLRALHFAFSSQTLVDAIKQRAFRDIGTGATQQSKTGFNFASVGDTPFALRDWSGFLELSGMQMDADTKKYSDIPNDEFRSKLGEQSFVRLRDAIRTAPKIYGTSSFKYNGKDYEVTGKLHHKVWIAPSQSVAIVGTSFNPSENAEGNNEQIVIVRNSLVAKTANEMFSWLYKNSANSVTQDAINRNKFGQPKEGGGSSRESEVADKSAKASEAAKLLKPSNAANPIKTSVDAKKSQSGKALRCEVVL